MISLSFSFNTLLHNKKISSFGRSNLISENLIAVANKPGVKIYPGQIEKALKILEKGKPINYEGATNIEFSEDGDTKGSYLEIEFKGKKLKIKKER